MPDVGLNFTERGSGQPVLLIHGFPLHQEIWNEFAEALSKSFHVITVDLPGFGKSAGFKSPFTIDDVAATLQVWLVARKINDVTVVGHSLGGYVALSMIEQNPTPFSRLCLFHSTAYADNQDKKESRNKVLEFIEKNGVLNFTSNFIAPLYADQQHPSIPQVKRIATQASKETVTGYTQAMRDRDEKTAVLMNFHKPILIIGGDKDPGIPVEAIHKMAALSPMINAEVLSNVGHMGMLEDPYKALELLRNFAGKSNQP